LRFRPALPVGRGGVLPRGPAVVPPRRWPSRCLPPGRRGRCASDAGSAGVCPPRNDRAPKRAARGAAGRRDSVSHLLEVTDLRKEYPLQSGLLSAVMGPRRVVHAVNGVSFVLDEGGSLGLAGESGCGKTTTAKLILRLLHPTAGSIRFAGRDIAALDGSDLLSYRRRAQFIFPNPDQALDPRVTIPRSLLGSPHRHQIGQSIAERVERVARALDRVHLNPPETFFLKYPHQLSGGQLPAEGIARALLADPRV